jgi:hypothetical protein
MKDRQGRHRTQSLFWETRSDEKGYVPLFTRKDYDHTVAGVTYPSLKKIYLSYDHIPEFEYEFAMDIFGSWDHWDGLANDSIFKKEIRVWRQELEIKLKAQAIRGVISASRSDDAKGVQAMRYLADKGYAPKRGRPSKEEVERERKIAAGVKDDLAEDMARLGLTVINGTK